MNTITVDQYVVALSNTDKALFPRDGITKGELIDYYAAVAGIMLKHIENRPVTLQRFPDGIETHGFFQKEAPDYFPDWVGRVEVETKEDDRLTMAVCDNAASIVYFAELAAITMHIWLSKADRRDTPDKLVFDLDPPGTDFNAARLSAIFMRGFLYDELGLPSFAMTTGGCGVHVVVPLVRSEGFDDVRPFAEDVASFVATLDPDRLTTEQRKESRGDRVYIDTLRNSYGATSVAPYSVRPRDGAPIAMPLHWDELDDHDLQPRRFNLRDFLRKPDSRPDPWEMIWRQAVSLDEARERLDALYSEVANVREFPGRTS